jgi:hypothetical protein
MTRPTQGLITAVVIAVAVFVQTALAQATQGAGQAALTGKVTDATGAVIVGATIAAAVVDGSSDSRFRREATTAADGAFVLDRLVVGALQGDRQRIGEMLTGIERPAFNPSVTTAPDTTALDRRPRRA